MPDEATGLASTDFDTAGPLPDRFARRMANRPIAQRFPEPEPPRSPAQPHCGRRTRIPRRTAPRRRGAGRPAMARRRSGVSSRGSPDDLGDDPEPPRRGRGLEAQHHHLDLPVRGAA
jgi:hypothetical protein